MNIFRIPLGVASLAVVVAGQTLPYNPTRVLLADNSSTAYIFQTSNTSLGQSRLLSLDLSNPISTAQTAFTQLADGFPFLEADRVRPFAPVIDSNGNITAFTGDCADGAQGSQVWRFSPSQGSSVGNGTWQEYKTAVQDVGEQEEQAGANFLAAGMTFSEYKDGNTSDTSIYIFGGMCPDANSSADTWTSNANYSNLMLTLSAQQSDVGYSDYDVDLASARGPPIAEAGFTITGLQPTYSAPNLDGSQKQQQNFVLLGGHTQAAFINMSQVALFSLPQESWTFLPVTQPQGSTQVEPRSGHTAVLLSLIHI